MTNEETYHVNLFVGIKNPLIDLPISAARWIIEGLAAAGAVPFETPSNFLRIAAGISAVGVLVIAIIGWLKLWKNGHWYAVGMAFYFLPIFVQWGARIKPRYMTPIVPILFVQLCLGISVILARWKKWNLYRIGSTMERTERLRGAWRAGSQET